MEELSRLRTYADGFGDENPDGGRYCNLTSGRKGGKEWNSLLQRRLEGTVKGVREHLEQSLRASLGDPKDGRR